MNLCPAFEIFPILAHIGINIFNKMPEQAAAKKKPTKSETRDLEIKDANLIFESVWSELLEEFGQDKLRFPKEIFWLNGAPGAGKGTQTEFIMKFRDLTASPILVSDLLKSPEAQRLKDAGLMVGDREVTSLVLRKLIDPTYESGAVVDGYPRTRVQVECLKLLYNRMMQLRRDLIQQKRTDVMEKSLFHIIVLFIDEAESIHRQLLRGRRSMEHNEQVRTSGVGEIKEVRKTDLSEEAARNRYLTFKEITYDALKSLREVFHYHFINAHGSIPEIQDRIVKELRYQSTLELDQATYDTLNVIPISSQIVVHSRQELVKRLDDYQRHNSELFKEVVELIQDKFLPIVMRHSITGMAYINSESELFSDPLALAMLIDIFSERGYHALVDIRRYEIPEHFDLETGKVTTYTKIVYRFRISFPGSEIRRGR